MKIIYKEMGISDLNEMAMLYMDTFNSEPWNEKWTLDTATKRLHQMLKTEDFYGLCAYKDDDLCGAILGSMEQFYNGFIFNIKEFWVKNGMRGLGIGTDIFREFERQLKRKGVKEIILFTSKGDYTERFYIKQNMITNEDMVFMTKQL